MKIIYFFKIPAEIIVVLLLLAIFILNTGIVEIILTLVFFFFFLGFCFGIIMLLLTIFTKDHMDADSELLFTIIGLIVLCAFPAYMFVNVMYDKYQDKYVLAYEIIKEPVELKIEHPRKTVQPIKNLPIIEYQNGTRIEDKWDGSCIECTRNTGGYVKLYLGKKYKYFSVDTYSTEEFSVYADDVLIECNEELTDNDEEHIHKKFYVINKCEYLKIKIDDEFDLDNACVYKAKYKKLSKKRAKE